MSDEQTKPLEHHERPMAVELDRRLKEARDAFPEPPCGRSELDRQHELALKRHRKAQGPK